MEILLTLFIKYDHQEMESPAQTCERTFLRVASKMYFNQTSQRNQKHVNICQFSELSQIKSVEALAKNTIGAETLLRFVLV